MGQYRRPYEITAQFLGAASDVLDWGCGNGHFSRFLLAQGRSVCGYSYEPPPEFVLSDPRFLFVPGVTDDPRSLPFADATFDAVFSVGVLEHVHELGGDEQTSVAEVVRVLRPGGRFFVFHLPNRTSWIEGAARLHNRIRATPVHVHHRRFGSRDVSALFAPHGVRVIARGRYAAFPRNSLGRLPRAVRDSPLACGALANLDKTLGALIPALCQNWYVVVEKQR